jgi:hypothetical protein
VERGLDVGHRLGLREAAGGVRGGPLQPPVLVDRVVDRPVVEGGAHAVDDGFGGGIAQHADDGVRIRTIVRVDQEHRRLGGDAVDRPGDGVGRRGRRTGDDDGSGGRRVETLVDRRLGGHGTEIEGVGERSRVRIGGAVARRVSDVHHRIGRVTTHVNPLRDVRPPSHKSVTTEKPSSAARIWLR